MKKVLLPIVNIYIAVLLTFLVVQKPLFMLMNLGHGDSDICLSDLWDIYRHGLALDFASTGYVVALPAVIMGIFHFIKHFNPERFLRVYFGMIAFVLSVVTIVDASLYEFWEFKLDNTVFFYINDPKNAAASVSVWYIIWHCLLVILLSVVLYRTYCCAAFGNCEKKQTPPINNKKHWYDRWYAVAPTLLVCYGLIFAGIRGIDIWPNTPSKAYYSKVTYFNHCAVNPLFNMVYSLSHRGEFRKEFRFFEDEEVDRIVKPLFPTKGTSECLLTTQRPNILYIIMEGMGALFVENLNTPDNTLPSSCGEEAKIVAPNLSKIMQEGICFDKCYCGSFRTDRGTVCAISGYLGQPTSSIMRYSKKVATLPGLPKTLKKYGYDTQVLYASDITFFNMSDYFLASGHDNLVSQDDFTSEQRSTKWGVPDHIACEWLAKDVIEKSKRGKSFYTTFLTVSSHAPFDVPYNRLKDEKYNSFAYTDECIGKLIETLNASSAWDNLLVIITSDHGYNYHTIESEAFPYIPFLMTGGVVKENRRISIPVNQTDIPATILGQLGISHEDFPFSRDVLADTYVYPFAYNTFNNGFNYRDSTGVTVFDNITGKALSGHDDRREKIGKAILQYLYNDIDAR